MKMQSWLLRSGLRLTAVIKNNVRCLLALAWQIIKMQSLLLRSGMRLIAVIKKNVRSLAVNASSVNNESTQNLKSWKEIPGPKSRPFIGPLLSFLPGGELHGYKGMKLSEMLFEKYGPIVRLEGILGSPNIIIMFDPNEAEQVLRGENTWPIRHSFHSLEYYRKHYNKTYDPQRQTGLLSDHGEKWMEFRSKVTKIMLQPKSIKLYQDLLEEVANDMVVRIKSKRDENNMITKQLDLEINLWALESTGVVAFGTRLNCFDPNLPEDSPARKLIHNVHNFFSIAAKVDFGPNPWRYFSTPNFRKAMAIYKEHESLSENFINKALEDIESRKKDNSDSDSVKPILQKLQEIDVEVALIMTSDMLLLGVVTASNTALATFYLLALNPEKQRKLRDEVMKKQKSYLRACIKESMRMLPVVSGNLRQATKDYSSHGYKIPKDMLVTFGHQLMANMKENFPKPDQYIPERWIVEKDDPLYHGNAHPFANSPFGFGVRMCVGRQIAELEMETFIAKVIENFHIEWTGGPLNITAMNLNYITGPFNYVFKDV